MVAAAVRGAGMQATERTPPRLLPPHYFALSIVLTVLSPLLSAAYWPETWPGWPRWLGLAPMLLGVLIASRASRQFTVADTNIVPFTAASALVTDGVFAWSRNPMYLGMIAFVSGLAWAVATPFGWVVAAGFAGVLRQQFVLREEQQMAATFGEAYRSYCRQVRRWL